MRRELIWMPTSAVLLCLGLASAVCAEPPARPGSSSIMSRWLHGDRADKKKAPARAESRDGKATVDERRGLSLEERMARERDRAEKDYLRQSDACIKLKQIAEDTRDDRLRRLADALDQRFKARYDERLERAGANVANHDLDEDVLDKNLRLKPMLRNSRPLSEEEMNGSRRGRTAAREEN